jgi:LacI family transcriptional regulator
MIKMTDIAAKAGVSRSAVSLVLNDRPDTRIPEATRQRIIETAIELGYRPNQLARAVASGKTRMIGYLVSEPNYEPTWKTIMGALAEAEALGFTLKVFSVTRETFVERVRQCVELRLGGIVASLLGGHHVVFEEANRAQIPVAIVDPGVAQPFGANVMADDAIGLTAAIEHLHALGHRRIGFISSGFAKLFGGKGDIGTAREALFERILQNRGLAVPHGYITGETMDVFGPSADAAGNLQSVFDATQSLIEHPAGRPTAICCWRDETAMVAIQACDKAGLRVPDDISIVGFSDLSAARFFRPPLSTVQSPWDELGHFAVRELCRRIEEEFSPEASTHLVPSRFVARQSTGPVDSA